MTGREFREAFRRGERLYGTLLTSASPFFIDAVADLRVDCVFIDTEHIPADWHDLKWMLASLNSLGIVPIVRIPKVDAAEASRLLDLGGKAIVAPYVESVEEVKVLAGAVKWRPIKGRRVKELVSGTGPASRELTRYIQGFNAGNLLLVNIESLPAVEALEEIVSVPELDGVMLGPHDLSCSLGIPEQYDHPIFEETMEKIIDVARAKELGVGAHNLQTVEEEIGWMKRGVNLVLHLSDVELFKRRFSEDLASIRCNVGDSASSNRGK